MRLQKFLAAAGVASRRKAEELIVAGRVKVNGQTITVLGTEIDDEKDVVVYDGASVKIQNKNVYIALHKPVGYISSASSSQGESVVELVDIAERVYPVGRLDKDSSGLIILTNDGEFANLMTHPKFEMEKEYVARLDRALSQTDAEQLKRGMRIEGRRMTVFKVVAEGKRARLVLREGANRQIRKMLGHLGYSLVELQRVRIGKLRLGTLAEGKWKKVKKEDIL